MDNTNYKDYQGFKEVAPQEARQVLRANNGVQITEALFVETIQRAASEKIEPLYTLKEYDHKGKPSAYQIYISSIDEADAAMRLVGGMSHWKKLCKLKWFVRGRKEIGFDGLDQWREDMKSRDRTLAKSIVLKQVQEGNVAAARTLEKWASDDKAEQDKDADLTFGKSNQSMKKSSLQTEEDEFSFLSDIRG